MQTHSASRWRCRTPHTFFGAPPSNSGSATYLQGLYGILSFGAAGPETDDFSFLQKKNSTSLTFQTVKQDLREHNKSPFYRRNLAIKFLLKIIRQCILKVLWPQPVRSMFCISSQWLDWKNRAERQGASWFFLQRSEWVRQMVFFPHLGPANCWVLSQTSPSSLLMHLFSWKHLLYCMVLICPSSTEISGAA